MVVYSVKTICFNDVEFLEECTFNFKCRFDSYRPMMPNNSLTDLSLSNTGQCDSGIRCLPHIFDKTMDVVSRIRGNDIGEGFIGRNKIIIIL